MHVFLCFRSSFPFFSAPAASKTPVVTCSGRVAPVGVGDVVHLVEDTRYVVKKLFPDGRTCLLQKVNDNRPPFRRFLNQLWVRPPLTAESVVEVDLPTNICLCPDPVPPKVKDDAEVQVDLIKQDGMDKWCNLMTDFSSVEHLERAFNDAKQECIRPLWPLRASLSTRQRLHMWGLYPTKPRFDTPTPRTNSIPAVDGPFSSFHLTLRGRKPQGGGHL